MKFSILFPFTLVFIILIGVECKSNKTTSEGSSTSIQEENEAFTITFGSCNHQDKPQPLWKDISAENPDLWIWLGDNIYGDSEDMTVLRDKYDKVKNSEVYKNFSNQTAIIGTWDDHDYGINDGDKNFSKKEESKTLALDFLGVASDAEVRSRPGLYQSFKYDYKDLAIRILLLDGRSFRDPLKKVKKKYIPERSTDILGESQWAWLEGELQKEEDLLIIGCGIQFIPEEHRFEKWANFPSSQTRFFELLAKEKTKKIILLSGDRHIGEISKLELPDKEVYEVTSSGLTHSYRGKNTESNKYRIGTLTQKLNYGVMHIHPDNSVKLELCEQDRKRHLVVDL